MFLGYKQSITHINEKLDLTNICVCDIPSNISRTHYHPELSKVQTVEEALKLPVRYSFYFVTKNLDKKLMMKHICYFDNENEAKTFKENVQKRYLDIISKENKKTKA